MGRLDNIVARNKRGGRFNERTGTMILVGMFLLVIIALAAFTDLGQPPADDAPAPLPHEKSIHVPLAKPRPTTGAH